MAFCQLAKANVSAAGYVAIALNGEAIQESIAKDRSTKPRIREIPKAIYGADPLTHMGSMILDKLANGYTVLEEDMALSTNRITSLFVENTTHWLTRALKEVCTPAQGNDLNNGKFVSHGSVVLSSATVDGVLHLRAMYLRSALNLHAATFLALMNRCSQHTETADHSGATHALDSLVKGLVQYESLTDPVLDRLQTQGIALRTVDFRQLSAKAMSGFVGL